MTEDKLWLLYNNNWNHLTVSQKISSGLFIKCYEQNVLQIICIPYLCML